ncbi:MAG: hypothetical protein GYA66_02340, partial [Phyllobacteriaceae bacterium]|nr:hypothetical protein [Phyllobacteriaceae bacterium]
ADWFAGDPKVLAATYSKFVASSGVDRSSVNLVTEIDQKLPLESYTDPTSDPMLLAVQLLRLMRQESVGSDAMAYQMKPDVLEAHRGHFVGQEALFDYLSALRTFLVDKDADTVLRLVSDAAPTGPMDYLTFSRQMLRAAALDAKGDGAARALYLSLLPHAESVYQRGTVEMALAKYEVQHKNVSFLFEDGSPIQNPDIRIRLLDDVAGPIILKMQATSQTVPQAERDAALYRLLMRDLTQGRFKGFLSDVKLLPPTPDQTDDSENDRDFSIFRWEGDKESGYDCPGIVEIAKTLAANAKDVKGRLCLGDFYRLHYIDPGEFTPPEESFGGRGTLFAGAALLREDFYKDIMKDPKAGRNDRAYALYRAVHCYQGTNNCGGDSDKSVRKAWYNELKARYGDTVWAKNLRYYW